LIGNGDDGKIWKDAAVLEKVGMYVVVATALGNAKTFRFMGIVFLKVKKNFMQV
jgi:hypothetical protein